MEVWDILMRIVNSNNTSLPQALAEIVRATCPLGAGQIDQGELGYLHVFLLLDRGEGEKREKGEESGGA